MTMDFAKFVLARIAKYVLIVAACILFALFISAFPEVSMAAVGVICVGTLLGLWFERAHADYKGGKKP